MNKKIIKFIYNILKFILFTYIVIYVLFIAFQRISGNSSIFGYRAFTISTASMEPDYKVNDVILVKETNESSLKIGDDIAYLGKEDSFKGKMVTHRIIDIESNNKKKVYHTKGIANGVEDPAVSYDQVYGKVLTKLFIISLINKVLKNTIGFIIFVFIPLFIVIILEVVNAVIDYKTEQKEESEIEDIPLKESDEEVSNDEDNEVI